MHVTTIKAHLTLTLGSLYGKRTALVISNMIGATIFGTTGLTSGALGSAP